ncbi:hypothetical protein ACFFGR_13240 [Arthrobacter liuii]|uniref:Uncharacterized protein n=1 Tax=Arthrobacter liuii TaxID=1476996 RepID=A0ABQ2AVQ3_9MICC|nr:hypothetical protein [Arthrobacter liuii]GGH99224.1 hypothetical protein GCM10007170_33580 [Arthrobacter liuii]
MTQTASSPLGPQLTVSVPEACTAVEDVPELELAAAADLAGPLAAGPLASELEPHLAFAVAAVEEEDVLSEVWRTSSHLESMQWELDNAQESLRQVVRKASAAGVAHGELCTAANLAPDELAAVLMAAATSPVALQP